MLLCKLIFIFLFSFKTKMDRVRNNLKECLIKSIYIQLKGKWNLTSFQPSLQCRTDMDNVMHTWIIFQSVIIYNHYYLNVWVRLYEQLCMVMLFFMLRSNGINPLKILSVSNLSRKCYFTKHGQSTKHLWDYMHKFLVFLYTSFNVTMKL